MLIIIKLLTEKYKKEWRKDLSEEPCRERKFYKGWMVSFVSHWMRHTNGRKLPHKPQDPESFRLSPISCTTRTQNPSGSLCFLPPSWNLVQYKTKWVNYDEKKISWKMQSLSCGDFGCITPLEHDRLGRAEASAYVTGVLSTGFKAEEYQWIKYWDLSVFQGGSKVQCRFYWGRELLYRTDSQGYKKSSFFQLCSFRIYNYISINHI